LGEFSAIGRLFSLGSSFENYRSRQYFWATFSMVKVLYKFWQKMSWATFWAILSQTHLATLLLITINVKHKVLKNKIVNIVAARHLASVQNRNL
jgi:hypothetical protein